jgi:arylsulfatase
MARARLLFSALALAVLGAGFYAWRSQAFGHKPRSVILVTIDTLRADHLSLAGYPRNTSPRLDAFAKRGTSFEWAISACSYTLPSHASMMTGLDPSYHSVGLMNGALGLEARDTTLAEICRSAGLRTRAVISNLLLTRNWGLDQGFEEYDDSLPDQEGGRGFAERRAEHAMASALDKLSKLGDEPFFFWLHLQDPHGPYTPPDAVAEPEATSENIPRLERVLPIGTDPSGFRAIPTYQAFGQERAFEQYRARYDREIRSTDRELGRLFDALDARHLLDSTLVVITADHGEALSEDDFFFAHGHSVGLDQVHVPLVIVGPGVRPGVSIHAAVSNMGVFATALEFLDLPAPQLMHSKSLLSVVQRGSPVPADPFFCSSISQRGIVFHDQFLRTDRVAADDKTFWKMNPLNQGYLAPLGTEAWNLGGAKAQKIDPPADLARRLAEFSADAEASLKRLSPGVDQGSMDESVRKGLRALGYAK